MFDQRRAARRRDLVDCHETVFVTPHAVQRYQERYAPRLGYQTALARLIDLVAASHKVRDLPDGRELWRAPRRWQKAQFIMGRENSGRPQVVTVWPPCKAWRCPT